MPFIIKYTDQFIGKLCLLKSTLNIWIILWNNICNFWHLNLCQLFTLNQGWNNLDSKSFNYNKNLSVDFDLLAFLHSFHIEKENGHSTLIGHNFIEKQKHWSFVSRHQMLAGPIRKSVPFQHFVFTLRTVLY